ncbi:hypothetical protein [Mesorhizobium qingshengii]|uniref:hypothetical protein n=1 Tax=Mesorhizobium qingshengii TaxID=1165689 RepID=UPI00115FADA7|nr:hypothetical protein [Mesorhizobium qingshengii]
MIALVAERAAARAVHDAMPLLTRARKVTVFVFDPQADTKDADLGLLRDHLERLCTHPQTLIPHRPFKRETLSRLANLEQSKLCLGSEISFLCFC